MKALLIIDMQKEYEPFGKLPVNHLPSVQKNAKLLLNTARQNDEMLIIHIRHISPDPNDTDFVDGTTGVEFMDDFVPAPDEIVITKHYINAFSNPELETILQKNNVKDVLVCGLTSILCCDTTCRIGQEKGYRIKYISDAIGEFDLGNISGDEAHKYVDAVQAMMFSEVVDTENVFAKYLEEIKR